MANKNFRVRHGLEVAGDASLDGDLKIGGNDIKASDDTTAITLSSADVAVAGDLKVGGNDIKASDNTTAITLSSADVTIAGDLKVGGNDIRASDNTVAITLNGADVAVAGNLTVNGTTTTLNTENLLVEDNIIVLNSNVTGSPTLDAGIEIERGTSTNSGLTWDENADKWYQNRAGTSTVIPISTSELAEGTNEYFTQSRARQSVSVTDSGGDGSLSYDNSTGVFTYTGPSASEVRAHLSVTDSGGDGSLSYDNSTGVFTYTGPSASEVRAHLSAGTGVGYDNSTGIISIGQAVGTGDSPSFAGVTGGNISVGVATDNTIASTDTNGNIALAPNGTGIVTVSTQTDTDLTDGNYVKGNLFGMRSGTFTIPSPLTTISGFNGFQAVSSGGGNGYTATVGINQFNADTVAGVNSGGSVSFRNANGTNTAPTATTSGNVPGTVAFDGYATTGWAGAIATANSGGGTANISPLQIQGYARETFADSAGTVTNAGMGFRVRGFNTATSMSIANRINFIDHHPTSATYRSNSFTLQNGTTTDTMANFTTGGSSVTRVIAGTPGSQVTSPGWIIRQRRTDQATTNNGDGTSFRYAVVATNNIFYTLADLNSAYSSTGDVGFNINLANGDQTGATFSGLTTFNSKISSTTISAGTASATPGGSSVSAIATFSPTAVYITKPLSLAGSTSGAINLSAGSTPALQNYTLPQAYPTANSQILVSDTGGSMSWVNSGAANVNYLDANYTSTIGAITANTIYGIPLTSVSANNVTIATGTIAIDDATATGPTRITFAQAGRYNIQFSIQLQNTDNSGDHDFDIWLRKNTADVANSNTQYTIVKNNGKNVAALNLLVNPAANDYYELVYAVSNAAVGIETIAAITSPYNRPATPGIILTVVPVGA